MGIVEYLVMVYKYNEKAAGQTYINGTQLQNLPESGGQVHLRVDSVSSSHILGYNFEFIIC